MGGYKLVYYSSKVVYYSALNMGFIFKYFKLAGNSLRSGIIGARTTT
jgi:hypothetical protein